MAVVDRHEPVAARKDPSDFGNLLDSVVALIRFIAGVLGAILVVTGIFLAVSVFSLVHDLIAEPESLNPYLDSWAGTLERPAPVTETIPAEEPSEETAQEASLAPDSAVQATADNPDAPASEPGEVPQSSQAPAAKIPRGVGPRGNFWLDLLDRIVAAIDDGSIGRPIGAFFILLFALVLVRIPLALIAAGAKMLTGVLPAKTKTRPTTSASSSNT